MIFKLLKDNKGITLIEIIIVLSIIVIISAILAPNLLNTTGRARIRSDIQSALVLQNTIDLYRIETGETLNLNNTNIEDILNTLVTNGYLSNQNGNIQPQTPGANWGINDGIVKIDILNASIASEIINSLSQDEREMLINIP